MLTYLLILDPKLIVKRVERSNNTFRKGFKRFLIFEYLIVVTNYTIHMLCNNCII